MLPCPATTTARPNRVEHHAVAHVLLRCHYRMLLHPRHITFILFLVKPNLCDYFFNIITMGVVRHSLYRQPWPSCARSGETRLFPASYAHRARHQCGGGKQQRDGVYSAVFVAAAWWQHWQSDGGSAAVARQWRAARRQHWECEGGSSSALVAVAAAAAAQQWRAAGRQAVAERWRRQQHGGGVGSAAAVLAEAARQQFGGGEQHRDGICSALLPAQCSGSIGRAAEAARQRHGNGGQCSVGIGSTRVTTAAQRRR